MQKLVTILLVLFCLGGPPAVQAEQAPDAESAQAAAPAGEEQAPEEEGWSGFSIFLLVFVFSVLFILSSATALSRMGGKPPPRTPHKPSSQRPGGSDGKDRFRL